MVLNPTYRPNLAYINVYTNTSVGENPELLVLKSPRVQTGYVRNYVSPQVGQAVFTILVGNVLTNIDAEGIYHNPAIQENWKGNSSEETSNFITSLQGAWIQIFTYKSEGNAENVETGSTFAYRENLPLTPSTDIPDEIQCVFVGKIMSIEQQTGSQSQIWTVMATDIGGWLAITQFAGLPKKTYIYTEDSATYNMIHPSNLPDFNEKIQDTISGNKDTESKAEVTIDLPDISRTMSCYSFNGVDLANDEGLEHRTLWTGSDIIQLVMDYLGSYEGPLFEGIDVDLEWADTTQGSGAYIGMASVIGTYSSKNYIWEILTQVCDRKKGLGMYWTYNWNDDTSTVTATLNVFFSATVPMGAFQPTSALEYTFTNEYPVGSYNPAPTIGWINNDDCYGVFVSTEPCNITKTFNLADDFITGWPEGVTFPDEDAITAGGINSRFGSRFVLNPNTLSRMNGSGVKPDSEFVSEPWTEDTTTLGVGWQVSGGVATNSLTTLNLLTQAQYTSYEETIKLNHTIPVSTVDAQNTDTKNTPGVIFTADGPDSSTIMDDCTCRYLGPALQFNPPKADDGPDNDGVLRFWPGGLGPVPGNIYLTLEAQDCPPLTMFFKKQNYNGNEAKIIYIKHPVKPSLIFANTILAIDEDGIPITVAAPSSGNVATWISTDGETQSSTFSNMFSMGSFMVRQKHKMQWSINFIEPENYLGQFITKIDVPAIVSSSPDVQGIVPLEQFTQITVGSLMSGYELDFMDNRTTYFTDFVNFEPK